MSRTRGKGKSKSWYDWWEVENQNNAKSRDDVKVEQSADELCKCGWITALPICPHCGGSTGQKLQ